MNTRKRLLNVLALGVALAALFTISFARPARAYGDERNSRRLINALPPVGIAVGQRLHITFLNTSDNPFEIIPCILDGHGEDVKEGTSLMLAPGQMRSFEVDRSEVGGRTESHVQLRAVVHLNAQDIKHLVVTGEVIDDATGKSTIYVPSEQDPPEPTRGRHETSVLPPVGFTFGQTVHITFLNTGSNPFELEPCYLDGDDVEIKEGAPIMLAPGQMYSFDLSRSEIVTRTDSRLQVRAVAHVRKSDLKNLSVTGEVIEDETGRSSLFVPGILVGFDPQPDPPSPH